MMANVSYPGVYMEEVSSGVRPIEAASTSTAAFFGKAQKGPIGEVKKIFNFTQFTNTYGDFINGSYLAHGVYQFFNNGGSQCYVGRVAQNAEAANITIKENESKDRLKIFANSPGVWGNFICVQIASQTASDPDNQFNLSVCRENPKDAAHPIELESFGNLSMNPNSTNYVETVVNSRSNFITVEDLTGEKEYIKGYSESGDAVSISDLKDNECKFRISINDDGFQEVDLTAKISEMEKPVTLAKIAAAIQEIIINLSKKGRLTAPEAYSDATVEVKDDKIRITSGDQSAGSKVVIIDAGDLETSMAGFLKLGKKNGGTEIFGSAHLRPKNNADGEFYFLGDDTKPGVTCTEGNDGGTPVDTDYIGAFKWLDTIQDVSLIAVPGIGSTAVADAGMNYCRNRPLSDCFYIADMKADEDELAEAKDWRNDVNTPNSYGAVYFPWLKMLDPLGLSAEPVLAPPSGFIAGLYARTDAKRGVWKAPAGTEAMLAGAVGLTAHLADEEQGDLNKDNKSVCVIRKFPGSGIVSWGARTLSSDPEWKYIPVRRMAIMLRVSIYNGIQWAVFEPNDEDLWGQLRLNLNSFMMTLFRKGAFQGTSPSQAFFVKCDGETTTQDDINLGIVNVLVGFAPLKPAEFVVVKISQKAGQSS
jgi:phage tail sheath protein FI